MMSDSFLFYLKFVLLTLMPSHRDTARNGRNARNVLIERNAGISAAPAQIAPKFTNDSFIFSNFFIHLVMFGLSKFLILFVCKFVCLRLHLDKKTNDVKISSTKIENEQ